MQKWIMHMWGGAEIDVGMLERRSGAEMEPQIGAGGGRHQVGWV